MKLTVYMYPKCGTCRNAVKWLEAKGHELHKIDLVATPPSAEELRRLLALSGQPIKKLLNTSGEVYKELQLKDKIPHMSEDDIVELLSKHGKLIKRPIVSDGRKATIGFKEDAFEEAWPS